jgi:hypothetical protein
MKQEFAMSNETKAELDSWADRDTGMRCIRCMYFVEKEQSIISQNGNGAQGRCRKHAPTMGGFPVVFEADWCGDHRLK